MTLTCLLMVSSDTSAQITADMSTVMFNSSIAKAAIDYIFVNRELSYEEASLQLSAPFY